MVRSDNGTQYSSRRFERFPNHGGLNMTLAVQSTQDLLAWQRDMYK